MSKKKKSSPKIESLRGVASLEEAAIWLAERGIEDIECIVPDLAGVARGKMMPTEKFFSGPVMTIIGDAVAGADFARSVPLAAVRRPVAAETV